MSPWRKISSHMLQLQHQSIGNFGENIGNNRSTLKSNSDFTGKSIFSVFERLFAPYILYRIKGSLYWDIHGVFKMIMFFTFSEICILELVSIERHFILCEYGTSHTIYRKYIEIIGMHSAHHILLNGIYPPDIGRAKKRMQRCHQCNIF